MILQENKNWGLFHKTADNGKACMQKYYCNDDNYIT